MPRRAEIEVSGIADRDERVTSSTTFGMRKRLLQALGLGAVTSCLRALIGLFAAASRSREDRGDVLFLEKFDRFISPSFRRPDSNSPWWKCCYI
jgi:hypothetical protein